jgi:hypothetical protein
MNRSPFRLVCASDLQTKQTQWVFNDFVNDFHWIVKSTQVARLMNKVEAV